MGISFLLLLLSLPDIHFFTVLLSFSSLSSLASFVVDSWRTLVAPFSTIDFPSLGHSCSVSTNWAAPQPSANKRPSAKAPINDLAASRSLYSFSGSIPIARSRGVSNRDLWLHLYCPWIQLPYFILAACSLEFLCLYLELLVNFSEAL